MIRLKNPVLGVSVSVGREPGSTARRHDRRLFTPGNAEKALERFNEYHGGDLSDREAFNLFFSDAVAEYNRRRKPSRQILDYYEHVANEKARGCAGSRVVLEEVVLQVGNRDDAGITDVGYDDEEWRRLKGIDRENGVEPGSDESQAAAYVREHLVAGLDPATMRFDVHEWIRRRDEDRAVGRDPFARGSRAWNYLDDTLSHAPVAARQRAALEMVRETWSERFPNLHLVRFDIHADEPNGTIHAHAAYIPHVDRSAEMEAGRRVHGPRVQCSMKMALGAMGFENKRGSLAVEQLRASMREHMRSHAEACGLAVEDKGIKRERVDTATYVEEARKADRRLEGKRAEAADAERQLDEIRASTVASARELSGVLGELSDAREDLEAAKRDVECERNRVWVAYGERQREESNARRARALADVFANGYEPVEYQNVVMLRRGVDYDVTPEMAAIDDWFNSNGVVAGLDELDVPEPTRRAMRDCDEDELADRYAEIVREQAMATHGPGSLLSIGPAWYWADDELDLADDEVREDLERELWEAVEPAVTAGLDPSEPYAGFAEREEELVTRELDVERREDAVSAREESATEQEAANERRAADLTAAAELLTSARDRLSDVPRVEGRDADQFADDVVTAFADELAESGVPEFVKCAKTMRWQWSFGQQQRMVEDGCIVGERTVREVVLETVRRGADFVARIRAGLKTTIDRALEAIARNETAAQKASRTQHAATAARSMEGTTPTTGGAPTPHDDWQLGG